MNTTENNKLIAEFMELPSHTNDKGTLYTRLNEITGETEFLTEQDLNFERSWDWLMPVVEKVEENNSGVTIYKKGAHINEVGSFSGSINGFNHSSKIEQTYKAVVEFIKWYNENNPK